MGAASMRLMLPRRCFQMPSERLEIARHAIAKLIKDGALCVPRNQREYAWRAEHVTDLYQDIEKAISEAAPDYFLGSVVVARTDGKFEVFDGQQRLATSVIFLAAIRDWYIENGDTERAGIIEKEYLLAKNLATLEPEPKLSLSKTDNDFYLKRILSNDAKERASTKPSAESHERIADAAKIAAKQVRDIVSALPPASKGQALSTRVAYLTDSAMVICVEVPDKRSAYVVFETMNDRGLRPSAADLLKNHLFGLADNRIDEAERNWVAMIGALETIPDADDDIVVTYIRHLWASKHGLTRSKELFDRIQDEIKTKQPAIDFTIELATNGSLYSALLNPAHDMWNQYGPTAKKHVQTICGLRGGTATTAAFSCG